MIQYWALNADDGFDCAFYTEDKDKWERLYRHNANYETWIEEV